jgi:formate-dependent nitrite reductase membrane component NrfD
MGAGFQMLMSGHPLAIILGLGAIAAIGFFIYLALRGDKPDEKK